jgi:hypothetical protein
MTVVVMSTSQGLSARPGLQSQTVFDGASVADAAGVLDEDEPPQEMPIAATSDSATPASAAFAARRLDLPPESPIRESLFRSIPTGPKPQ